MKRTIPIIILLIPIIILYSCKKVDYDGTLRKIYGSYTLVKYKVDVGDSLALHKDSLGINFRFYTNNDGTNNWLQITGPRTDNKTDTLTCEWSLEKKANYIDIISETGAYGTGAFKRNIKPEFLIGFISTDLTLEATWIGKSYFYELRKL
jgi:hypothetical protein